MPQVKIAISIPQDILKTVDKLSKEKNVSRSAYISNVLQLVSTKSKESEILNRINLLFSDPKIQKEQKKTSKLLNKKINDGEQW
ncbi:MAG: hypothetical protein KBF93_17965 [Leptospiraceae bacterium]|nr:hypothetical protein [Leptospiraceae bacterium]